MKANIKKQVDWTSVIKHLDMEKIKRIRYLSFLIEHNIEDSLGAELLWEQILTQEDKILTENFEPFKEKTE